MLSWKVTGVKIIICAALVGFSYQEVTPQNDSSKSVCKVGTYGPGCTALCSTGCARSSENPDVYCDDTNGTCFYGCDDGYVGEDCNKTCEPGTYGVSCISKCRATCAKLENETVISCDFLTGSCGHGCISGYTGSWCNLTCASETYGPNCGQQCSATCKKDAEGMDNSCNDLNGACLYGCAIGYIGAFCTESCPKGMYGRECRHACPSKCAAGKATDMTPCNAINGSCLYGCIDAYTGSACETGTPYASVTENTFSDHWNSLFMMTLFAPVLFAIFVKLCLMKNRGKKKAGPPEENESASSV